MQAVEAEPDGPRVARRWVEYSEAKDEMFVYTDIPEAPWWVVEGDDKRPRASTASATC